MMTKLMINGCKNILQNKYTNLYCHIIDNRKINQLSFEQYTELHHIIPRCLGGADIADNLVRLSAREHYIAHWLLVKMFSGPEKYKMIHAFLSMNMKSKYTESRFINSKIYEKYRIHYSNIISENTKKLWKNEVYRDNIIRSMKLAWGMNPNRLLQKEFMSNNSPFKNKDIHKKTILKRTENNSNIFTTNNPMLNEESKEKKVLKTSGPNHYLRNTRKYYYKKIDDTNWIEIDNSNGLDAALLLLQFPRATFFKMITENYKPKSGTLFNIEVKREVL